MAQKKDGLLVRAADIFDLPADVVAGLTHIEINGSHDFFIENHKGILEYGDSEIKINAGKSIIRIVGQNLNVIAMNVSELKLTGQIESISFI